MARTNLDMDLLRTLVTVRETGSLSAAGDRLGRTQSAISLHIHSTVRAVLSLFVLAALPL